MKQVTLASFVCAALAAPLLAGGTIPRASRYAIDAAFFPEESRMEAVANVLGVSDALKAGRAAPSLRWREWLPR